MVQAWGGQLRQAARRAPTKPSGSKGGGAAAEGAPADEAAQRREQLVQSLRQLQRGLVAALEQLEQAAASWLATPQKQQVRSECSSRSASGAAGVFRTVQLPEGATRALRVHHVPLGCSRCV